MSPSDFLRDFKRVLSVTFSLFVLAGCLPPGVVDVPEDPDDGSGVEETDHEISGSVGDGPIVAATVRIRAADGTDLITATSDATAAFDVTVKTRGSYYPLRIDATDGTDIVTNAAPDFTLRSSAMKPGAKSVANINPFTTFAIEVANDLPGGRTEANLQEGLLIVGDALNSGLSTLAGTEVMTQQIDGGNIAEVLRASEALGEAVRRTRDAMTAAGRSVSGDDVVARVGSDLADGVLDGAGGAGGDARTSAVFGLALAQVSLEAAGNSLRVQGSDAMARLESAMSTAMPGSPSVDFSDLLLTADMLDGIRVGVRAMNWLQSTAALDALNGQVDQLSAGMRATQVRNIAAANASADFDAGLVAAAGASDAQIAELNTILRTGEVPSLNSAPLISGTPAATVDAGASYSFEPEASDADGDVLTFSITGMPSWATFDSATGVLSGVPSSNDVGTHSGIVISVTDGEATASLPAFSITVAGVATNTPPTISGVPAASVMVGNAYGFTPTASDADGDSLSFSIAGQPSWASFDAASGALTGTPQAGDVGTHSGIVISVSDGAASASLPAFSITVVAVPVNTPPVISGTPPTTVTEGEAYAFTPTASDADGDSLSFSIANQPAWTSFDSASGSLTGTPGAGNVGSHSNIVISVSDGEASVSLPAFTITVEAAAGNSAPTISGSPAVSVEEGRAYAFVPTASDADGDALSFSIENQPAWTSFEPTTGRLSGTPAAADVGEHGGIVISVSDGEFTVSLPEFSITVTEAAEPPVLGSIPEVPFDYLREPGPATSSGGMPSSIGAGEVLAFTSDSANGGDMYLTCNGTEENPAFIVGGTLNGSNDVFRISGSWCYFIDTVFNNIQVRTSGDHHVFRNIEVANVSGKNATSLSGSFLVVTDSEIHHNQGDDRHGLFVGSGSDSVWLLNNYVHHNGGDGFQACHGCSANPPRNVYLGFNTFHSDRENAIDFKYIENVIVEGNIIHSLVSAPADQEWCFDDGSSCGVFSSGSDGSAIVIGSDGGPTNVLVINNEIYGTVNAVRIEEGSLVSVVDNNFHDISGRCLQLDKDGYDTVYSGNTCLNAQRGIFQNWRVNFSLDVDNNVFENLSGPAIEYESASVGDASTLTDNLFISTGPVIYGNTSADTTAGVNSLPNASGNTVE